ncbi:MAG TPA: hypothetical protein VJ885_04430 [Thermoanaerobaculia bacterium]|nr:hypothetical protein [Thermoanaerobaculia bacterium]
MFRRIVLSAVLVFAGAGASFAQPSYLAGGWSCEELKQACKDSSAEDVYDVALYSGPGTQLYLGTCYVHDNSECPNCACWNYVKLSYLPNPKGWDGGTGCIGYTSSASEIDSYLQAAARIKQLCEEGACCCPTVTPKACAVGTPVKARDPITGSCCTFPNPCSAPTDWEAPIPPGDPRC